MFDSDLETRLSLWSQFRSSLEYATDPLGQVAEFWAQAPLSAYVHHVGQDDRTWPTPWQLLEVNRYDDQVLAIMIGYTVKLTKKYATCTVELKTMIDSRRSKLYNLIFIDDIYVLNYTKDQVVTADDIDFNLQVYDTVSIELP